MQQAPANCNAPASWTAQALWADRASWTASTTRVAGARSTRPIHSRSLRPPLPAKTPAPRAALAATYV